MNKSAGGIAIIRRRRAGGMGWLARWNDSWGAFHFVSGQKLSSDSYRACVIREVAQELDLSARAEFFVADDPLARVSYIAKSQSGQEDTLYSMELFEVEILPDAEPKIDSNPLNRWLSLDEIRRHRCEDGAVVSPTMQTLLDQTGLLPE